MFGKKNKKYDASYTIWQDGIPMDVDVDFGSYCAFMEEVLPYVIKEGGVYMVQVFGNEKDLIVTFEYFYMDGEIHQVRMDVDAPEHQAIRFGQVKL